MNTPHKISLIASLVSVVYATFVYWFNRRRIRRWASTTETDFFAFWRSVTRLSWTALGFALLSVVLAVIAALCGCVPASRYRRDVKAAEIGALERARKVAHYDRCDDAVQAITKRITSREAQP